MNTRDRGKYIYLTIAIEKGSPTHQGLLADAKEIGTKQYPTVAAMRLKDYYTGADRRGERSQHPIAHSTSAQAKHTNGTGPEVLIKDLATADANADAALDEWA